MMMFGITFSQGISCSYTISYIFAILILVYTYSVSLAPSNATDFIALLILLSLLTYHHGVFAVCFVTHKSCMV